MGISPTLVALGALSASTAFSANAQYQSGKANAEMDKYNARVAEFQAQDAEQRGRDDVETYGIKLRQLMGEQVAGYAGQGVDVGMGAPVAIRQDTEYWGRIERLRILNNAAREAWGYRARASTEMMRASIDANRGLLGAGSTILGSAASYMNARYPKG